MPMDIRKPLKKFLPHFLQAREANLNEADTVQRLIKFFVDVLGYDQLNDISREAELKGKYVDVVLKVDGSIRLLVEAKAAGEKLRERHIEQATSYASRNNYRWVILTNGVDWILWHLTFGEGIDYTKAFEVDLSDATKLDEAAAKIGMLHRQCVKKGELEDFWRKATALSPKSIGKALFNEQVLMLIRREIRREEDLIVDVEDLGTAIHELFSPSARELMGPLKFRKKKAPARRTTTPTEPGSGTPVGTVVDTNPIDEDPTMDPEPTV